MCRLLFQMSNSCQKCSLVRKFFAAEKHQVMMTYLLSPCASPTASFWERLSVLQHLTVACPSYLSLIEDPIFTSLACMVCSISSSLMCTARSRTRQTQAMEECMAVSVLRSVMGIIKHTRCAKVSIVMQPFQS